MGRIVTMISKVGASEINYVYVYVETVGVLLGEILSFTLGPILKTLTLALIRSVIWG